MERRLAAILAADVVGSHLRLYLRIPAALPAPPWAREFPQFKRGRRLAPGEAEALSSRTC